MFKEIDMATGEQKEFEGMYQLTVVGGGREFSSVRDYTEKEKEAYNFKGSEGSVSSPCHIKVLLGFHMPLAKMSSPFYLYFSRF